MTLQKHGTVASIWVVYAHLALLVLLTSTVARATEPWESDPIGIQAYNAYQGLNSDNNLDAYLNDTDYYPWYESRVMMSFTSMYEGTKNTAYLDRLVDHFDVVLSNGGGFSIDLTLLSAINYNAGTGESIVLTHNLSFSLPDLIAGDANGDGAVNGQDAEALAAHWLQAGNWADGDFNRDGIINDVDATMLASNWGKTAAAVPEPSMIVLLLAMVLASVIGHLKQGRS